MGGLAGGCFSVGVQLLPEHSGGGALVRWGAGERQKSPGGTELQSHARVGMEAGELGGGRTFVPGCECALGLRPVYAQCINLNMDKEQKG